MMKLLANGPMLSADLTRAVLDETGASKATRRRAWDDLRAAGEVEAYRPDPVGKGKWHSRRLDVQEHRLAKAA
jgi:hypothetical protein